jgi:hypothetical protein
MNVSGFREIVGPRNQNRVRGRLSMPLDADTRLYSFKWVKMGIDVSRAMQVEQVIGTNYEVDGWQRWKSKTGKPHSRTLKDGTFLLMFRPRALQENLQRTYGNISRQRTINEALGHTVAGEAATDKGMLVDTILNTVERNTGEETNDQLVTGLRLNPLHSVETSTTSGRGTTKKNK